MKEIVLEKKKTVSIDEIDNRSIIGGSYSTDRKFFVCCVREGHKNNFTSISFKNGYWNGPNTFGGSTKKSMLWGSVKSIVKHYINSGCKIYLFDSKRELFEWGLEDL